jgi:hypothetical protein
MKDDTKAILEDMLRTLQEGQASKSEPSYEGLYLLAANDQYLGEITENSTDQGSLSNPYGPYGSPYSPTSIFNEYSEYGSSYGNQSIRNPYCSTPPSVYRAGRRIAPVSSNPYIHDRIDARLFLSLLKRDIRRIIKSPQSLQGIEALRSLGRAYIEAGDGQLLGSLVPDRYSQDSVFNPYGPYGNRYSPASIFNKYSRYGDRFGQYSAGNPNSNIPPRVFINGDFVTYITENARLKPRVSISELLKWAEKHVSRW